MDTLLIFWKKHQQRLVMLTCMIFIILMMSSLVQSTLFVMDNLILEEALPETVRVPLDKSQPGNGISSDAFNLFGRVNDRSMTQTQVDAPETKLNLELLGVFLGEAEHSAAIIGQNNQSNLYQIGDTISGNAVLDSVYSNHILIRRGTRLEKLIFRAESMRTPVTRVAHPPPTTAIEESLEPLNLQMESENLQPETEPSTGSVIRQYVETHRDRIKQDPESALSALGVTPVEKNAARGYEINSSKNPLLTQAGLKPGDVILSVNGQPVGVAMKDSALLEQALQEKRIRVEVQRDTRKLFLTVPIP